MRRANFLIGGILGAIAIGAWVTYWFGYSRGLSTGFELAYDKQVSAILDSLALRHSLERYAMESSTMCEVDRLIASQLHELEMNERSQKIGIGWRDVFFGMQTLERVASATKRPTAEQIREKFDFGADLPRKCD